MDVVAQVQIDLTILVGLLAVVLTLLVWRVDSAHDTARTLFAPGQAGRAESQSVIWLRRIEGFLRILGMLGSAWMILQAFHYLRAASQLVRGGMDFGLTSRLMAHSARLRDDAINNSI